MKVSAKSDYAVRALLELAQAGEGPVKGERLAQTQAIPLKFLENILIDLRHAGIVHSQRGAANLQTVWIAVRASLRTVVDELTLADVVAGRLPSNLKRLIDAPDAWSRR